MCIVELTVFVTRSDIKGLIAENKIFAIAKQKFQQNEIYTNKTLTIPLSSCKVPARFAFQKGSYATFTSAL